MILQEILTALGLFTDKGAGADAAGNLRTGTTAGNVMVQAVGRGLQIKGGANARIGRGLLAAGAAVVGDTTVTAATRVFVTHEGDGGAVGILTVNPAAYVVGVSFAVASSNGADAGHFRYLLVEEI